MKFRFIVFAFAFNLGAVSIAASQPAIMSADMVERVRDSYIFVFDDSVSASLVDESARSIVSGAGGKLGHVYTTAIRGFSARMPAQAADQLATRNPNIAYYEADQIAFPFPPPWCVTDPDDPRCGGDGGDGGDGVASQTIPWGIARVAGGSAGSFGRAFVIDTGIDLDHPDLNVDRGLSKNFVSRGRDNRGDDSDGHGTHVAGTIAAIDNNIGVIGVAPGATVVSVRVLGKNGGTYSDVIAGVDYVALKGSSGDVANMSLGGGKSDALNSAVESAADTSGVTFVIAAGNSRADANNYSPASAEGTNVVTVSAFDSDDNWASFSNFANPPIDWSGPGVSVESTYKGGGYATLSGTSMAAPHVAGVILAGGGCTQDGFVQNDPDGKADQICIK